MDFKNNNGFGQPPQYDSFGNPIQPQRQGFGQPTQGFGQQPQVFGQQQQGFNQPQVAGFEQMADEFSTNYADSDPFNQAQHVNPFGAQAQQGDPFGAQAQQGDPFGMQAQQGDPFGMQAQNPFGVPFQQQATGFGAEPTQKWWQKGARVFLLAGGAAILLAIIVFTVSVNLSNYKAERLSQQNGATQVNRPTEKPVTKPVEQPVEQTTEQPVTQPVEQPVTQPVDKANGWQMVANTDGFVFVGTQVGVFVVDELRIYFRQSDGGMQTRSVASGKVSTATHDYLGSYEVDLPRTADMINTIVTGSKFTVMFDVYKAADGTTVFLENLRPDK